MPGSGRKEGGSETGRGERGFLYRGRRSSFFSFLLQCAAVVVGK